LVAVLPGYPRRIGKKPVTTRSRQQNSIAASLHIARRRNKFRRNHIDIKALSQFFQKMVGYSLHLNEIRKNLAANLERPPLSHSYGYDSAGDRPTLVARFPLSFVPFMQYAG